jgi:hypothetical protein
MGLDPATGELLGAWVPKRDRRLPNLKAVLEAAGTSFGEVVKTTIFLTNMGDFATVNEIYGELFDSGATGTQHRSSRGAAQERFGRDRNDRCSISSFRTRFQRHGAAQCCTGKLFRILHCDSNSIVLEDLFSV